MSRLITLWLTAVQNSDASESNKLGLRPFNGRVLRRDKGVLDVAEAGEGQHRKTVDFRALWVLLRRAERVQLGVSPDVLGRCGPSRHMVSVFL